MATVTGEFAIDFNGEADENPWSDANFTSRGSIGARILSGVYRAITNGFAIHEYSGGTYDGGPVTAKMEIGTVGTSGNADYARCGCLDENGDGYVISAGSTGANDVGVLRMDNWAYAAVVELVTVATLAAGSELDITVTKGSPNTIVARHNGSTIINTTDAGATLGTVHAVVGHAYGSSTDSSIASFAVDGLSSGSSGSIVPHAMANYRMRAA